MDMVRDDDWGWHSKGHMLKRESLRNNWRWIRWDSDSDIQFFYTPYDWEWISKNKRLIIAAVISLFLMFIFPPVGIPLTIYFVIKGKKSYDSFIREKIEKMQRCDNKQESE